MIRILFVLLCVAALPVQAESYGVRAVCSTMVEHQPDSDVHYHPGMQVQGEFDVPVNIENSLQPTHDVIKIPVTVDLVDAFGLTVENGVELEPDVAMIEVHMDGRVTYNGQDIKSHVETGCDNPLPPSVYDSKLLEGTVE